MQALSNRMPQLQRFVSGHAFRHAEPAHKNCGAGLLACWFLLDVRRQVAEG